MKKWLLASAALLVLCLLGYVVAGPYLAISGIRHVVARGEYGELERFVDFDALRASVSPQLQKRIASSMAERLPQDANSKQLIDVVSMVSRPAIDAMASPLGVATLLRGRALAQHVAATVKGQAAEPNDPLKDAETDYVSPSLFTATVPNAEGQPVVFEFRRSGLHWKLTGVRLPG